MGAAAVMARSEVQATEFKAKCLEMMDDVHNGTTKKLIVTKRGKPFVKILAADEADAPIYGCMKDQIVVVGDIMAPLDVAWEALDA